MEKLFNPRAASFPFVWSPKYSDRLKTYRSILNNKNHHKSGTFGYEAPAAPSLFLTPGSAILLTQHLGHSPS